MSVIRKLPLASLITRILPQPPDTTTPQGGVLYTTKFLKSVFCEFACAICSISAGVKAYGIFVQSPRAIFHFLPFDGFLPFVALILAFNVSSFHIGVVRYLFGG